MRISNNYYIDATFHTPPEFSQLLIFMYKDKITELKIPGLYVLMNGKYKKFYEIIFENVIDIITQYNHYKLNINTIVADAEKALIDVIKKVFPNSKLVICFFHYKQNIIKNLKKYGLYKDEQKNESNIVLKFISDLPFVYKGNYEVVKKIINDILQKYPKYDNFLNNYFIKEKMDYFIDGSLDYNSVPIDCRTNNYLENYNGFIKKHLSENRYVNWVNFLDFIKLESDRSITKLLNNANENKLYFNRNLTNIKDENINNFGNKIYNLDMEIKSSDSKSDVSFKLDNKNNGLSNISGRYNNIEFIKDKDIDNKDIFDDDNYSNILNIIYKEIGIRNFKYNCFANSFIQILIHL